MRRGVGAGLRVEVDIDVDAKGWDCRFFFVRLRACIYGRENIAYIVTVTVFIFMVFVRTKQEAWILCTKKAQSAKRFTLKRAFGIPEMQPRSQAILFLRSSARS
jgi:hypothetical protein